ncbi:DUF3105 domain-containing protein, partial [Streptomyces sp. NPDC005840]
DKQADPIMLTAWGHQRTVKSASDPDVDAFFDGSHRHEPVTLFPALH